MIMETDNIPNYNGFWWLSHLMRVGQYHGAIWYISLINIWSLMYISSHVLDLWEGILQQYSPVTFVVSQVKVSGSRIWQLFQTFLSGILLKGSIKCTSIYRFIYVICKHYSHVSFINPFSICMSFIPRRKIDTLLLSLGMKNAWFYLMMFVTWIQFFFGQSFLIIFFLIFSCMIFRWRWLREQARIVHCSGHSNFSDPKNFIVNQKAESFF